MFDIRDGSNHFWWRKSFVSTILRKFFPISPLVNNNVNPIVFTERPNINGGDHWTKELMQRALDPDHKFQDVDDLYTESMYIVLQ